MIRTLISPHHETLPTYEAHSLVLGERSTSGAGRILQVNLLTGEEVEDATMLDHAVKQSVVLPYTDSTFRHPVLVLDAANQGHIVPDTQENRFVGPSSLRLPDLQLQGLRDSHFTHRNLVAANADKIHIYLVDKEKASVEGYGIDGDITKPMTLLWNVYFSSSSEVLLIAQFAPASCVLTRPTLVQVVEAIAPSRSLSVGLPVLIRGDNSVTPKYLNKNLLAVRAPSWSYVAQVPFMYLSLYSHCTSFAVRLPHRRRTPSSRPPTSVCSKRRSASTSLTPSPAPLSSTPTTRTPRYSFI